jgi:hypothetical protein
MHDEELGAKEANMYWPKRDDPSFQSVMNTYILVAGFGLSLIGLGISYQTQVGNDKEVQAWIIRHEALHKERQAQVESVAARTDERLRKLEGDSSEMRNLQYRVTVNEQASIQVNKVLEELKILVNDQGSDIRVMREVLVPGQAIKRR